MRKKAGLLLMLVGLLLASMAALLVLGMAQQSKQQAVQQIKQVYIVTMAKDLAENSLITPDMLAIKPFPAEFAPAGAVATVEETTGKYTAAKVFKDSVLLRAHLSGSKRARDVASNLPPGKVAFWLPLPELINSTGGVKAGDRIDVLLTVNLKEEGSGGGGGKFYSTQTTLQNVEVFAIGTVDQAIDLGATAATADATAQANARAAGRAAPTGKQAIVLLVDHQDAVILKFVKDAEQGQAGIIDLVLRSTDDAQIVRTDGMSPDTLVDRFKFRVPSQAPQPAAPPAPRP